MGKKTATATTTENKLKTKKVVRTMHCFNVFIIYAYDVFFFIIFYICVLATAAVTAAITAVVSAQLHIIHNYYNQIKVP